MNTIGQRIFYYRKKKRADQKEFARRLAVCPQTVSKWENDRSLPDLTTVARIAALLSISCDALILGDND